MWMETSAQHFKRTTPTEVSFGLYESRDVHSPTDQRACGVVVTPLDRNALPKEMERARRKVAEWRNASKTGGGGGVSTDDAFTNSRAEYKNILARAVLQDVREERQRQGQGRRIGEIHLLPFYAITATRGNLHPGAWWTPVSTKARLHALHILPIPLRAPGLLYVAGCGARWYALTRWYVNSVQM